MSDSHFPGGDKPDELAGTEQPFVQHLMELRDRMIKAVAAIGIMAIILGLFPGPGTLYDLLAAPLVLLPTGPGDAALVAGGIAGGTFKDVIKGGIRERFAELRRMGIRTVAVYSAADANARHVMACDEAVLIGGPAPRDSYLRADRILEVAKATGAQAAQRPARPLPVP